MIKTENLTTIATFGKNGVATISVGDRHNALVLQELKAPTKIGEGLSPEDVKPLPCIELHFFDEKSIDVMINRLNAIKNNIKPNNNDTLSLAC